jgi:membrane protein YqaA with SNARE-associated domain
MADWSLFISALISSTLLPGGSELLLGYQVNASPESWLSLVAIATAGNLLGSMLTFAMGWWVASRYPAKFLNNPNNLKASGLLQRFGPFALLLAWLPIIGDPLCLVAGWLRFNVGLSLLLIGIGKLVRYLLVATAVLEVL